MSISSNKHVYSGTAKFYFTDYQLKISGQLYLNNNLVARFDSITIKIDNANVHMIYQMDDSVRNGRSEHFIGYCVLYLCENVDLIRGMWAVVNEPNCGTIKFERKS